MNRIEFFIPGLPKPGGSKTGFVLRRGGKIVTRPNGAPVVIMKDASDNADEALKSSAPKYHTNTPDSTKLMRSTEDALSGIAWADDKQIARQFVQKVYGDKTGARVTIIELENEVEQAVPDVPAPLFESVT